jgi:hypothetical protein
MLAKRLPLPGAHVLVLVDDETKTRDPFMSICLPTRFGGLTGRLDEGPWAGISIILGIIDAD